MKELEARTPSKTNTIGSIHGNKRESATKDRKDWVCCEGCMCWSYPSCYRVAQVVAARDDVHFRCFFSTMKILIQCQVFVDREKVSRKEFIEMKESFTLLGRTSKVEL